MPIATRPRKMVGFRMPEDLVNRIEKEAKQNHRSLSSQIIHILAKEMEAKEDLESGKTQVDMEAFR